MPTDAQQAVRDGLELFRRTCDRVWWVEGGLTVRCENFTDRDRARRAAGPDPERAG